MKRKGFVFEQITDIDNLRLAFYKAQKGKSAKADVAAFRHDLDKNLSDIRTALLENTYSFGKYHYFTIYDPKQRVICAADFAERVIHHAIMNVCAEDFERYQISSSFACRKGKGTFAAVEQAAAYQKRYKWFLKLDVKKYFDSIDHKILFEKLQRIYKDPQLLGLFWKIIDSYCVSVRHSDESQNPLNSEGIAGRARNDVKDEKGVPIGNLTSQYFANHYLSYADRYIKENLQIPAYVRYMDDMLLWADSREELMDKGEKLQNFLQKNLELTLKPFVINKTAHGLPALGFLFYPSQIRLDRRSRNRFAQKMKQNYIALENGIIDEKSFADSTLALYGFISHANSKEFAKNIIQGIAGQARNDEKATGLDTEGSNRVNRGGSWNNNARNVRVSNRNNNTPDNRNNNLGFRLASSTKQVNDFEQVSQIRSRTAGQKQTNSALLVAARSKSGRRFLIAQIHYTCLQLWQVCAKKYVQNYG